ncbi:hypothetical protein AB3U99_11810 [Niallia sp. JL1B1071]|uniref:hypothetical protein n=1 Tax=Niallia tiangongensis TaxID=3237105 RepID=UPI0037DC8EE0
MVSVITFIVGILVAFFTFFILDNYFSYPVTLKIFICYILVLIIMYLTTLVAVNTTRNINKLEKLFKKNRKHPYYSFVYAISNKDDRRVITSYRILIKQKKYQPQYALFTIIFSLYFNKTLGLKEEVEKIKQSERKAYYQTLIFIKENNLEEANRTIKAVKKKWMKEALLAEMALKNGEADIAKKHAKSALKHTKGIQYYTLKKTYERELSL